MSTTNEKTEAPDLRALMKEIAASIGEVLGDMVATDIDFTLIISHAKVAQGAMSTTLNGRQLCAMLSSALHETAKETEGVQVHIITEEVGGSLQS